MEMECQKYIHLKGAFCIVIIFILTEIFLLNYAETVNKINSIKTNKFKSKKWNGFVKDERPIETNYGLEEGGMLSPRGNVLRNQHNTNESTHDHVTPVLKGGKTFKILQWTGAYYGGSKGMAWLWQGEKSFEMCEYKNCYATFDRTMYNNSDAVLFHMRFLFQGLPQYRFPYQKWIMNIREPALMQHNYTKYNGIFNTTWTYHRKSDIWTNYSHVRTQGGLFVKKHMYLSLKSVDTNYALGKRKMAAWIVSNCQAKSQRLQYVKHLQKYVPVDIFGSCGTFECAKTNMSYICLQMIERDYKFYLSFENSICDDYVTEKLWNALHMNIVPVVLGAYNYSELLPPHSYIDVKDYKSPQELANHLKLLDKNDSLYSEYLKWKDEYDIVPHPPFQCSVCEYLNRAEHVTKTYDRLDLFWDSNTDCHSPSEFYKNVDASSWE